MKHFKSYETILTPIARTNGNLIVDVQVRRRLCSRSAAADNDRQRLIGASLIKPTVGRSTAIVSVSLCILINVLIRTIVCRTLVITYYIIVVTKVAATRTSLGPSPTFWCHFIRHDPEVGRGTRLAHTELQTVS